MTKEEVTERCGRSVLSKAINDSINVVEREAKLELLEEFKKVNPYYYMMIEECLDFQRIIKKLRKPKLSKKRRGQR